MDRMAGRDRRGTRRVDIGAARGYDYGEWPNRFRGELPCADTAKRLDEIKRFDMAGFQPRPAYLREMKRYGLLPKDQADGVPVDYYALEQKYWRSFWHQPATP